MISPFFCFAAFVSVSQRNIIGRSYRISLSSHLRASISGDGGAVNANDDRSRSRRSFFVAASRPLLAPALLALVSASPASGACLSGDVRAECIGVYKIPVDAPESSFVDTPENLKVYAPDLKWVPPVEYPSNYADAVNDLRRQRQRIDAARDLVASGDIEKAGLAYLDIIPKVNVDGIVILRTFEKASNEKRNAAMKRKKLITSNDGNPSSTAEVRALEMKAYRIEYALNELTGVLGETDVLMGQGLRGELGVSAPAQIQILSNIADCQRELGNLLLVVPDKMR